VSAPRIAEGHVVHVPDDTTAYLRKKWREWRAESREERVAMNLVFSYPSVAQHDDSSGAHEHSAERDKAPIPLTRESCDHLAP
jgi:hypothetical protein